MTYIRERYSTSGASATEVEEINYSRDSITIQKILTFYITKKAIEHRYRLGQSRRGIYIFFKEKPPHLIYLGKSETLERRITEQRRLRSSYSYVLIIRIEGFVNSETLSKIETGALYFLSAKWPWAKWANDRGVYDIDNNTHIMDHAIYSLLDRIRILVENTVQASKYFDPSPVRSLPQTHEIGSPHSELYAIGSSCGRGMTVLKGSRLPLSFKSNPDLRLLQSNCSDLARKLYREGIITRRPRNISRMDGLYFTQDYHFSSKVFAASLVSMTDNQRDLWTGVGR